MAFTDFSFETAVKTFNLEVSRDGLFTDVPEVTPSGWLLETLKRGQDVAFNSEKSRSEYMIAPVLLEVKVMFNGLAVFSGQRLDVDSSRGLTGECDYIIAKSATVPLLQTPILSVVEATQAREVHLWGQEAKRQDIEMGYGQTVAQMVAALEFNQRDSSPLPQVYGCITTGENWQFLRLENSQLVIENKRHYLSELGSLLGSFKRILEQFL
jgi:hypothetical protein